MSWDLTHMKIKGCGNESLFFESLPDAEFLAAYISAVNPLNSYINSKLLLYEL